MSAPTQTAVTRSEYVAEHYDDARAESPLLEAGLVVRKLQARYDALHAANQTPCTSECDPGNCEVAHREHFGWDVVEEAAAFDRDWRAAS